MYMSLKHYSFLKVYRNGRISAAKDAAQHMDALIAELDMQCFGFPADVAEAMDFDDHDYIMWIVEGGKKLNIGLLLESATEDAQQPNTACRRRTAALAAATDPPPVACGLGTGLSFVVCRRNRGVDGYWWPPPTHHRCLRARNPDAGPVVGGVELRCDRVDSAPMSGNENSGSGQRVSEEQLLYRDAGSSVRFFTPSLRASNALPSARRPQELHCAGSAMSVFTPSLRVRAHIFRRGGSTLPRPMGHRPRRQALKRQWDGRNSYIRDLKNRDSYRDKRTTPRASRRSSSPKASTSTAAPRGPRARPSRVVSESDEEEDGDGRMRDRQRYPVEETTGISNYQ
ncbi:hypothetical protein GGX14DRAFT_674576 [Mycena pura]|uniref:Uncharacterized protein n=1 Tax=Mycena pura TaxID=153505 RepID=A0AAD6Y446_9AGAR|nr:hypothetical protein GGX14DRAFT_674576 [Mycena pura]